METTKRVRLTASQVDAALRTGYDIDLNDLVVYALRANVSYNILGAGGEVLTDDPISLIPAQVIVSNIDGDVQAQVTSDAIRIIKARLTSESGGVAIEFVVNTALQPDFETAQLDEDVTVEALEQEFRKRDLQDLATQETTELPANAVKTENILDESVTANKLAVGSVTEEKIAPGAVTALQLGNSSVNSLKIRPGSVGARELADNAVRGSALQDGTVTLDKLSSDARSATGVLPIVHSNSIGGDRLADNTVGELQLANNTLTSRKIREGSIGTRELAPGAVTGDKVAPRSLNLEHFADDPSGLIADGSVSASKLQEGSVSRDKLTPGLLGSGELETDADLSGLDIVALAGTLGVRQPCGLFRNSAGDLQVVAVSSSAPFYGVIRSVRDDGTCSVASVPGAFVSGYSGLTPGSYYKPDTAGTSLVRTTVKADAVAIALDANTIRIS